MPDEQVSSEIVTSRAIVLERVWHSINVSVLRGIIPLIQVQISCLEYQQAQPRGENSYLQGRGGKQIWHWPALAEFAFTQTLLNLTGVGIGDVQLCTQNTNYHRWMFDRETPMFSTFLHVIVHRQYRKHTTHTDTIYSISQFPRATRLNTHTHASSMRGNEGKASIC